MRLLNSFIFRPILPALVIGLLVSGTVLLLLGNRPAEYSARVGLLAAPEQNGWTPEASSTDFPAVAAQSMAAIADLAHSPSVLSKAGADVDGAPSPDALFDDVSVELVPGSSLARVTVTAESPVKARDLVRNIANQIVGKNLLAPVGSMRMIDDEPHVTEKDPGQAMALGLALASGVAAAAVVYALCALLRPSTHRQIAHALGDAGVDRPVPVMDGARFRHIFAKIDMLATAAARPVRVIGLTPGSARDAEKLQLELAEAGVRVSDSEDDRDAAVIGLTSDKDVSKSIRWTMAALPNTSLLIAIVVQ